MAVRKKVRTVTVLPQDGSEPHKRVVTTTAIHTVASSKSPHIYGSFRADIDGKSCTVCYCDVLCFDPTDGRSRDYLNAKATALLQQTDIVKQIAQHYGMPDHWTAGIDGEVVYFGRDEPWRYVRVVSISPGTLAISSLLTFRHDFEEWAEDQFPEHRPYILVDVRGCFVACEHPDDRIRDSWLAACRLRWG